MAHLSAASVDFVDFAFALSIQMFPEYSLPKSRKKGAFIIQVEVFTSDNDKTQLCFLDIVQLSLSLSAKLKSRCSRIPLN